MVQMIFWILREVLQLPSQRALYVEGPSSRLPFNIASRGRWCKRWGMKIVLTLITVLLLNACVANGTQSIDPVTGKVLKKEYPFFR